MLGSYDSKIKYLKICMASKQLRHDLHLKFLGQRAFLEITVATSEISSPANCE